jgi:hypothetical protein
MKKLLLPLCAFLLASTFASAQTALREFDVKKVNIALIDTPDYQVIGPPKKAFRPGKWLEIEVNFDARPEFTDELVFNYYVYINKRLFVGQVNHVNIEKGMDLYSVIYMSPKMLARVMSNGTGAAQPKTVTAGEIVATVQITKPGIQAAVAEKSSKPVQANWWAALKQETGFLSGKNDTPFAPLYWDRYEAIKSTPH